MKNNKKIYFGNIKCDNSYVYSKNYTFFRLWKHNVTNNIVFYRASKNKLSKYTYELVFAKNCHINNKEQKTSFLNYYIDFICIQSDFKGRII